MAEPDPLALHLLTLAAEGAVTLLNGCADLLNAGGKGHLLEKANEYFGPAVVSQWSAWLRSQSSDQQRVIIENLANISAPEARREATAAVRRLVPLAKPQDEAVLIEFLTVLPGRVKLALVPESGSGRRKLPVHWVLESDQNLADLLTMGGHESRSGSVSSSGPANGSGPSSSGPKSNLPMPSPLAFLREAAPSKAPNSRPSVLSPPKREPIRESDADTPAHAVEPDRTVRREPLVPDQNEPHPAESHAPLSLAEMNRRAKAQMARKRKELGRASREIVYKRRVSEMDQLKTALALQIERNAWKEALRTLEAVLRIDPRDPDALESRTYIEEQMAKGVEDAGGEVRKFTDHQAWVNSAAFFPDGRRVLTVSGGLRLGGKGKEGRLKEDADRSMRIWDYVTGEVLRHFSGLTLIVNCVALTPDGLRILVGGRDGDIYLWDADTGKIVRRFETAMRLVTSLAMSPDGKRALSGSDDKYLRLWDVTTGRRLNSLVGHAKPISSVAYSKDGKRALTGSMDKTMRLWDIEKGTELRVYKGHSKAILCVAFSPDNRLALSGGVGSSIRLWEVQSGNLVHRLDGHSDAVHCVTFSPDGRWALSGSADLSVRLWEVETGKEVHRFVGHTDDVRCVLFAPDGKLALSASRDTTVRLWRVPKR
jgi:WD40 repeat protein